MLESTDVRPPRRRGHLLVNTLLVLVVVAAVLLAVHLTIPYTNPFSRPVITFGEAAAPRGDLPADAQGPAGWQQTFVDDFTTSGAADAEGNLPGGLWWGYPAGTPITNSANGVYDAAKTTAIRDGKLVIRMWADEQSAYGAAFTPTVDGSRVYTNQTYGRYDVRYRYTSTDITGYKSVWMLWPNSDRWEDGEIDFTEYHTDSAETMSAALHEACPKTPCPRKVKARDVDPLAWHTGTAIWSPGEVRTYVDGHLLSTSTVGVPDEPMHLMLQAEASSSWVHATPGSSVGVEVDWVSVYQRR